MLQVHLERIQTAGQSHHSEISFSQKLGPARAAAVIWSLGARLGRRAGGGAKEGTPALGLRGQGQGSRRGRLLRVRAGIAALVARRQAPVPSTAAACAGGGGLSSESVPPTPQGPWA